jgi:hypothetical protein
MKRITFTQLDAVHLYEALLMSWNGDIKALDRCVQCENLRRRLEIFITTPAVRRIRGLVKKYPKGTKDVPL